LCSIYPDIRYPVSGPPDVAPNYPDPVVKNTSGTTLFEGDVGTGVGSTSQLVSGDWERSIDRNLYTQWKWT